MNKHNSYLKVKDYFELLVYNSNFINDFVGFFSEELHTKEQSYNGIQSPYLALYNYSANLDGEDISSVLVRNVSFVIIFNNVPHDDFEKQYEAIDQAEKLALKVLSRMRYDSQLPEHLLFNSLQKNSIEIRPVVLKDIGTFGVEVDFQLKNKQSLKVYSEDWKDGDSICKGK